MLKPKKGYSENEQHCRSCLITTGKQLTKQSRPFKFLKKSKVALNFLSRSWDIIRWSRHEVFSTVNFQVGFKNKLRTIVAENLKNLKTILIGILIKCVDRKHTALNSNQRLQTILHSILLMA